MPKKTPNYLVIADALQASMQSGKLAPGEKLPSEQSLCQEYHTSRHTVRMALDILQEKRLIEKHQGSRATVAVSHANVPPNAHREQTTIAVITPFMNSYVFPKQISGIESVLTKHNCSVNLGVTYRRFDHEAKILRSILNTRPDGVIAEPTSSALPPINAPLYRAIQENGIPVLFINTYLQNLAFPYVALDDQRAGLIATQHLIDMGHRQIAYMGKIDTYTGHLRFAGYAEALVHAQIPLDERRTVLFPSNDMDAWLSPMLVDYLLSKLQGCTAVFCYNDQIACTLIEILRQKGIQVPHDISIVSIDDSDYSRQSSPPCTTIRTPSYELGATAAEMILKMIESGKPVANRLFEPVLIQRDSVAKLET